MTVWVALCPIISWLHLCLPLSFISRWPSSFPWQLQLQQPQPDVPGRVRQANAVCGRGCQGQPRQQQQLRSRQPRWKQPWRRAVLFILLRLQRSQWRQRRRSQLRLQQQLIRPVPEQQRQRQQSVRQQQGKHWVWGQRRWSGAGPSSSSGPPASNGPAV